MEIGHGYVIASVVSCGIYFLIHALTSMAVNGGLVEPPLKLGHQWLIVSHMKQWVWLLMHSLIMVKLCYEKKPWAICKTNLWLTTLLCYWDYLQFWTTLLLWVHFMVF